ncbi:hypothetical protein [Dyadobacter sp. MSC1_007]|jgi:hypothetical protein|uniref:hypothetical protein n=1 Tax=Dyadobacter sp. MSC1_007 TaxID=2909264 RepID=UPI00202FA4CE|nr:hypothetical protein [Dyadobacter sp. MSC1_007]
MKKLFLLTALILVFSQAYSQDTLTRKGYIGLDVINSLPSVILPKQYYIRNTIIIEPYYLLDLPRPNRRLVLGTGFAHGSTHQHFGFDPSQHFKGAYFRAAHEIKKIRNPRKMLRIGYGPVFAIAGYQGKFRFDGPTFGDYEGDFKETNNVALGIEAYFGQDFKIGDNWLLRFTVRNVMGRRTNADTYVQYFPGFGFTPNGFNNRFLYSGGLSLQIHYNVR